MVETVVVAAAAVVMLHDAVDFGKRPCRARNIKYERGLLLLIPHGVLVNLESNKHI